MANTIMSAKNSFQDGLLLDFSPENSKATSMTAALNATLVTFNGNEMSLQNDMGNGRVETAFLPEGYVPVGSCEFGDIIYIVSYNPLINKSQIGCFPSPERNISSEELGGLQQSLSWKDFQEGDTTPNGELKASSVKKILYDNRDMTPGDKYIIYSSDLKQTSNNQYLSDYGNKIHEHEEFPKLAKIHVVSIEESGKIVYLDSTTKWYDNNYYLNADLEVNGELKDIDSYRTMVSSAYSVFSSKVSGKLALLVELEKITGFSCSWEPYVSATTNTHTTYDIYWNFNWTTDNNNINPDGAILVTSEWTGVDKNREGQYQNWTVNGSKIELSSTSWTYIGQLPTPYNKGGYQSWDFSRHYKPENTISFDTFIKDYDYDKYLSETIKNLMSGNLSEPYKLNINRNNSIPQEGSYYVNCTNVIDSKYYTQDINGAVREITATSLKDDFVNNYFHYPIVKKFASFNIPTKQILNVNGETIEKTPNISNLIYHYEVAPTMPYGILREFTQEGYIDFSKIGTKSIALNTWKYYNYENTSTLTWGMEAYTEPGKGISEVVFEFYDNQGFVAAYHTKGKNSYNGVFTEYITLNESGSNYKLNNVPAFPEYEIIDGKKIPKPQYHKGLEVLGKDAVDGVVYLDSSKNKVTGKLNPNTTYYQDDSGTLYPNLLYLVKIIVKYCNKGILDEYIEPENDKSNDVIIDYRWFWTNTMFNEYYYQVNDFKGLQFTLNLNGEAIFESTSDWKIESSQYIAADDFSNPINSTNLYKSLSANVQHINQKDPKANICMAIRTGLIDSYNTFNINRKLIDDIDSKIFLGDDIINNFPEQPRTIFSEEENVIFSGIYPINSKTLTGAVDSTTSNTLNTLVGSNVTGTGKELSEDDTSYLSYVNNYSLYIDKDLSDEEIEYVKSSNGEIIKGTYPGLTVFLSQCHYDETLNKVDPNKAINFIFKGIHYSKYYYFNVLETQATSVLKSFVTNVSDLEKYALGIYNNSIQYTKMYLCSIREKGGAATRFSSNIVTFQGNKLSSKITETYTSEIEDDDNISIYDALLVDSDNILDNFKFLFPFGFGWNTSGAQVEASKNGIVVSSNREVKEGTTYTSKDLGGTLAGITIKGNIEPGDYMRSENSLTRFTPIVLGYLTQLFYLSDDVNNQNMYYPDNYVYLEDNYSQYSRDIILSMKAPEKANNIILMSGIYYDEYLTQVQANVPNGNGLSEVFNSKNVNLQLKSVSKTCPIQIRLNYIKPFTTKASATRNTFVKSLFSDIPSTTSQNFNKDTIYYYDFNTGEFSNIKNAYNIRKITNYNIDSNNIISISASNNYQTFSIYNTKDLLTIDNECITFKSTPAPGTNTYSVKVTKSVSGDSSRKLTDFKSGLYFYRN